MSAPNASPPNDLAALQEHLRSLRQRLDDYGLRPTVEERSWDELVDLYHAALEDAATRVGIAAPDRPTAITRRFTRPQRERLEEALAERGIHVR